MRSNSNQKAKVRGPRQNPKKKGSGQKGSLDPPSIKARLTNSHRFRYRALADIAAQAITSDDLIGLCGVTTSTAILAHAHCSAVRVKSVEMWGCTPSATANGQIGLVWSGGANGVPMEKTDISLSTARPAHLKMGPPKESLAGFWQGAGATLFYVTIPQGGVLDVILEFIYVDAETPATYVTVGATIGNVYYKSVSTNLQVVGLRSLP